MKKPYVIGIAGGSASGKSTFANKLKSELTGYKLHVFHMDKYFKQEKDRPLTASHVSGVVYVDDNHPLTMDLTQLANDIQQMIEKNEHDVIIIEGLLTMWEDEIYNKLDLKLFLDCRSDERIVRRLKRNMEWGLSFDEISNVYLDMVRFRHDQYVEPSKWRADFILNGSVFSEQAFKIIVGAVKTSSSS